MEEVGGAVIIPSMDSQSQAIPKKIEKEEEQTNEGPLYRVIIHNDDVTPMDFVIDILISIFMLPSRERHLRHVHRTSQRQCLRSNFTQARSTATNQQGALRSAAQRLSIAIHNGTGMTSPLETLTQINLDDLINALGIQKHPTLTRITRFCVSRAARKFAKQMIDFDSMAGTRWFGKAARLTERLYVRDVRVFGADHLPDSAFLALSNHPGMTDTLAFSPR